MNRKVKLADTEWKIMLLLWKKSPLSCRQIEDSLKEETGWTRHTIISFSKRMIWKRGCKDGKCITSKTLLPVA